MFVGFWMYIGYCCLVGGFCEIICFGLSWGLLCVEWFVIWVFGIFKDEVEFWIVGYFGGLVNGINGILVGLEKLGCNVLLMVFFVRVFVVFFIWLIWCCYIFFLFVLIW